MGRTDDSSQRAASGRLGSRAVLLHPSPVGHSPQRPPWRLGAVALLTGVAGAVAGCLATFAPALRPAGVHAEAVATDRDADCMTCHEAEATALARMQAAPPGTPAPQRMAAGEPGLVPDWMIGVEGGCLSCHTLRPARPVAPRARAHRGAAAPAQDRAHGEPHGHPHPGAHEGPP